MINNIQNYYPNIMPLTPKNGANGKFALASQEGDKIELSNKVANSIKNFGIVQKNVLYRGSEPHQEGIEYLHNQLGVKTIVSLRDGSYNQNKEDAEIAKKLGVNHVEIPMDSRKEPTEEQVQTFFNVMEKYPKPVYIHCYRGKDRTGYMCARYRMKYNGFSGQQAVEEKAKYGGNDFFSKYFFNKIDKKLQSDVAVHNTQNL